MALTVTVLDDMSFNSVGYDSYIVNASVAFDSSYPTGGEAITAADFGLSEVITVHPVDSYGYTWSYDKANGKLLAYGQASAASGALSELDDTTDLSGLTGVSMFVYGR